MADAVLLVCVLCMVRHQLPLGRLQESESIRAVAVPSPPAAKPAQDLLAAPQEPQTETVVTEPVVVVEEAATSVAAAEPAKEPAKAPAEPAAVAPAAQQQAKPAKAVSETSSAAAESGAAQAKPKRNRSKKNTRKGKN